mmetsp:Transcript_19720/g.28503  ORF Transcript_19720/g.28503 Transcript_19720/m.28503 type:complete len:345 (-) Transcript_19720:633-1667(-)
MQLWAQEHLVWLRLEQVKNFRLHGVDLADGMFPSVLEAWSRCDTPIFFVPHQRGQLFSACWCYLPRIQTFTDCHTFVLHSLLWWLFIGHHEDIKCRFGLALLFLALLVQAIQPLVPRDRHLDDLFRQLDAGLAVDLHQLVHAAQGRLLLARGQMGADAKDIDLMLLFIQLVESLFIDVVAGSHLEFEEFRHTQCFCHFLEEGLAALGELGEVPRVQAHPLRHVAQLHQGRRNHAEVGGTRLQGVVGVHQCQESLGKCQGISSEGCQFTVIGVLEAQVLADVLHGLQEVHRVPALCRPQHGVLDVVERGVGLHESVGVGALDGYAREHAGRHVAGGEAPSKIGIL